MAFQDNAEREHWYHMLKEMLCGWELSQSTLGFDSGDL